MTEGPDDDPGPLAENRGNCFVGNVILGLGFTFDDADRTGEANTLEAMRRLVAANPVNAARIFPYINGEEVNQMTEPSPSRFVISFGEMSESEARKWPELMEIVERKVRPTRLRQASIVNPARWWMFARPAAELYRSIAGLERVLVRSLTSTFFPTFAFLPAKCVFDQTLVVFAFDSASRFALLAARIHETWARFLGGTMKDDPRYNVEDCFGTFPFPDGNHLDNALEEPGRACYVFRAHLMVANNQGLTTTYNRFHDRDEQEPAIFRLRELHDAMDRAVLDAYGWTDIQPTCEFILDYEEDDEANSRRRKPWRYRWPDELRDEVLARLLELNRQRAKRSLASQESLF